MKESCLENSFSGILLHILNPKPKIIRKSKSKTKNTKGNLSKHFLLGVMDTRTQQLILFMEIEVLQPYEKVIRDLYRILQRLFVKNMIQRIMSYLLQRLS